MDKTAILIFLICMFVSTFAHAQQKPNEGMDKVFRAANSNDLMTRLPPRFDENNFGPDEGNFLDSDGPCPNEINIGAVTQDTPVYGGVDINVVIDSDIVIQCGGLRQWRTVSENVCRGEKQ